ncbi:MAG: Maf family protein [Ignavibacteria bacterium]|nr:Maf family protein [Ignavibacteria bacterium]
MIKISKLLKINQKIVLASKSPRRITLLKNLGLEFDVIPSKIDENISEKLQPNEYVIKLSRLKAENVSSMLGGDEIVIGADTTVYLDGNYLHKPKDCNEAFEILKKLSGRTHQVYTGITLINNYSQKIINEFSKTDVTFRELSDDEIYAYIESGSPMDKAGAYGIQDDFGAVFVRHINGCYYNIVGLPIELFYRMLKESLQ